MGAVKDFGRKRPDGGKIVKLRKEKGLKQETLADQARISVRLLGDIERKNHPVPTTMITAIAAELKVNPSDITFPPSDASPINGRSLLKLRAIHSATELSALASRATKYEWRLKTDPTAATGSDMQQVMTIVRRLVEELSYAFMDGSFALPDELRDEFDQEPFGEIRRLESLQDRLTRLHTNGVNVIAATYTHSWLRSLEEATVVPVVPDENPSFDGIRVRRPGTTTYQIFKTQQVLSISFVTSNVEEEVVPIWTGPSLKEFELHPEEIPY